MWIKIIFAIVIIISLLTAVDKSDQNKVTSMHLAAICIAGIIALTVMVIWT